MLAEAIGIENILKLAKEIGGECIYFPKLKSPLMNLRDEQISKEFNGHNASALAGKHGLTSRRIYMIVQQERRKADEKRARTSFRN